MPGTLVMAMDSGNKEHRELLDRLGVAPVSQPAAYVCCGKSCLAPARDYQQLIQRLAGLSRL